jgi:hypothetical protein
MQIRLNQRVLSEVSWQQIFENLSLVNRAEIDRLSGEIRSLESLRKVAQYNTGSISAFGSLACFAVAAFLRPQVIAEVGTFIGRSAISLCLGAKAGGVERVQCHTCDFSNDFTVPAQRGVDLIQYPGKSSVEMFQVILSQQTYPDLIHVDGRLGAEDLGLISMMKPELLTFLLDDFEGTEKGVANAMLLRQLVGKTHILIYPPAWPKSQFGEVFDFGGEALCALYLPRTKFTICAQ